MNFLCRFALLSSLALAAYAQSATDYSLNDGTVRFQAPADWSMILQKAEGNPQAIAFQVKDPADQNTNAATRVTIDTRKLGGSGEFATLVSKSMAKAKQMPAYTEEGGANDATNLRFTTTDAGTRYQYRDSYIFHDDLAIHVRCVRPLLSGTTAAWNRAYEQGCDLVTSSVKQ